MCFETALVLAYLTNRRLVMPKEYRRHDQREVDGDTFRPLHPKECFELEKIGEIVPLVEREEYDGLGRPEPQVDLAFEPGTAVFCIPHAPLPGSPEAHRLPDFAASRKRILELTPEIEACRTLNIKARCWNSSTPSSISFNRKSSWPANGWLESTCDFGRRSSARRKKSWRFLAIIVPCTSEGTIFSVNIPSRICRRSEF
jgi:hypothetical protein